MTRVAPPFQVPTSPVRPCRVLSAFAMSRQVPANVPSGPSKCPVRSQRMSRQVPNVPSGPSQCPVNSLLNSFPGPDANSVKFCQERSHKSVDVARVGPAVVALLRSHRKAGRQTPIVLSRFVTFWSVCCGTGDTGRPKKCQERPDPKPGGKNSAPCLSVSQCAPCPSVGVPPVRLSVCLLSVCQSHCHCDH